MSAPRRSKDLEPTPQAGKRLEQLKQEAICGLDRFLTAVVDSLQVPSVTSTPEREVVNFLKGLMIQVFENDLRFGVVQNNAGWGTIHRFWNHCNKMHPGWASKDTFYGRMSRCLPFMLSQEIVQQRAPRRRHGMGRAKKEFRIDPNHPDVKDAIPTFV